MRGNRSFRTDVNHKCKACRPGGAVDPLSVYIFMYPYDWKHLPKGIVERASVMGVLGPRVGLLSPCFRGGLGE